MARGPTSDQVRTNDGQTPSEKWIARPPSPGLRITAVSDPDNNTGPRENNSPSDQPKRCLVHNPQYYYSYHWFENKKGRNEHELEDKP